MLHCIFRSRLAGLLLLSCMVAPAAAQNPLNLASVLDQTLRHHPVLARIDAQRRQLDPGVDLARQSPPLRIGLETENLGDDTSDRLETTLTLAGVLEWGNRPDARAKLALTHNQASRLRLQQQRRDVLAAAASRFIALIGAQAELTQTREAQKLAQQVLRASQRRQQAGAASQADLKRAELLLAQADMAVQNAQQAHKAAGKTLQLAMGLPDQALADVQVRPQPLPALPDEDDLLAAAQQSPALLLAEARQNLAHSQLNLARLQARPSLSWTIGLRDQRERDSQSALLGFSLPLGQSRRTQPKREQAMAGVEQARHQRDIALLELQTVLIDSHQALDRWRRVANSLEQKLIPQGEAMLQAVREGYSRGRYSLLELSSAAQELNQLRSQRLAARIAYQQSWIELERLLGRPLIPENPA